jgi:membrane-bound lytic murein transglycosylase B
VAPEVLAAVWGTESDFGRLQGPYDLLAYWATRAAVGDGLRDPDFGEAARIVVAGPAPRSALRCFADGSFGQIRWFPRQHAEWSADGDGDAVVDPWRSPQDALASASNAMKRGWGPGGWVAEVLPPDHADPRNQRLWEGIRRGGSVRPEYVRRADGGPWSAADAASSGAVLQPAGEGGPMFLTLRNFEPIRFLNGSHLGRFAGSEPRGVGWALAVGLLANAIRGEALVRAL